MPATIKNITPDPERHARKCTICHHERREEIDEKYLDWSPIGDICSEFNIEERNLYRHVQALGLDEKKRQNSARYLQRIMERVPLDQINASDAIAAARLLLQMEGKLVNKVDQVSRIEYPGVPKKERDKKYAEILKIVREGKLPEGYETEEENTSLPPTLEEHPPEFRSTRHPLGLKKF